MKRYGMVLWMGLAALAGIMACGSVVTGGGGSGGAISWASYCDARAAACGISALACKEQQTCARALLRDNVEDSLFECLESNCDEDLCFARIVAEFPQTTKGEQFSAAHDDYLAACPNGNNDVALAAWIVTDDLLDDYQACAMAPSCMDADICFQQVNAIHVDPCQDWL